MIPALIVLAFVASIAWTIYKLVDTNNWRYSLYGILFLVIYVVSMFIILS